MSNAVASSALSSSVSGSSRPGADIIKDIVQLIAPSDRPGFDVMLEHALRSRQLPDDELRQIAVDTWHQFVKYGWPRE